MGPCGQKSPDFNPFVNIGDMSKILQIKISAALIVLMISSTTSAFGASEPPVTRSKSLCGIEVGNAHISSYLKRTGTLAVKANAYTDCVRNISKITLYVKLFKVGKVRDHLVKSTQITLESLLSGEKLLNQETFELCVNTKRTKFYALAQARAMIDGKWKSTPWARSEYIKELDCGTRDRLFS